MKKEYCRFFGYELSHRRMTWPQEASSGITERTMSEVSSSLESSFVHRR